MVDCPVDILVNISGGDDVQSSSISFDSQEYHDDDVFNLKQKRNSTTTQIDKSRLISPVCGKIVTIDSYNDAESTTKSSHMTHNLMSCSKRPLVTDPLNKDWFPNEAFTSIDQEILLPLSPSPKLRQSSSSTHVSSDTGSNHDEVDYDDVFGIFGSCSDSHPKSNHNATKTNLDKSPLNNEQTDELFREATALACRLEKQQKTEEVSSDKQLNVVDTWKKLVDVALNSDENCCKDEVDGRNVSCNKENSKPCSDEFSKVHATNDETSPIKKTASSAITSKSPSKNNSKLSNGNNKLDHATPKTNYSRGNIGGRILSGNSCVARSNVNGEKVTKKNEQTVDSNVKLSFGESDDKIKSKNTVVNFGTPSNMSKIKGRISSFRKPLVSKNSLPSNSSSVGNLSSDNLSFNWSSDKPSRKTRSSLVSPCSKTSSNRSYVSSNGGQSSRSVNRRTSSISVSTYSNDVFESDNEKSSSLRSKSKSVNDRQPARRQFQNSSSSVISSISMRSSGSDSVRKPGPLKAFKPVDKMVKKSENVSQAASRIKTVNNRSLVSTPVQKQLSGRPLAVSTPYSEFGKRNKHQISTPKISQSNDSDSMVEKKEPSKSSPLSRIPFRGRSPVISRLKRPCPVKK